MRVIPIFYFYIILTKQINFLSQYPEEWIILPLTANCAIKSYSEPFQSNYVLKIYLHIILQFPFQPLRSWIGFVNTIWYIGFAVLTTAIVKNSIFWDITRSQVPASCWSLAWLTLRPWRRSDVFLLNVVDFHRTTRRYIAAVRSLQNLVYISYFVHIPGSSYLPPLLPKHVFPPYYSSNILHASYFC